MRQRAGKQNGSRASLGGPGKKISNVKAKAKPKTEVKYVKSGGMRAQRNNLNS